MPDIISYTVPINGSNVTLYHKDAALRADIAKVKDYIEYPESDEDALGLDADFENNTFTRLGAAVDKTAGTDFDEYSMYGRRKLCNVADNGTVNAWYGDNGYTEDGSNGQVMVWQPKFYYKVVPMTLTSSAPYYIKRAKYYICPVKLTGYKVHPAFLDADGTTELDGIFISAYEGSIYDVSESKYLVYDDMSDDGNYTHSTYLADFSTDKLSSIAGVKPASGNKYSFSRVNMEAMAQNRGPRWHHENTRVAFMEQLLFAIEYGTFNSQTAIGNGVTNISDIAGESMAVQTGATASLGNGTGVSTQTKTYISTGVTTNTASDKMSVRYRGRENDWGNMWKLVNGVNIYGNGTNGGGDVYYCTDYAYAESKNTGNYVSTGIRVSDTKGKFIKHFGYNETYDWMFFPTISDGATSSALPVGDVYFGDANFNGYRGFGVGARWNATNRAGIFAADTTTIVGFASHQMNGRIMCLGQAPNS